MKIESPTLWAVVIPYADPERKGRRFLAFGAENHMAVYFQRKDALLYARSNGMNAKVVRVSLREVRGTVGTKGAGRGKRRPVAR